MQEIFTTFLEPILTFIAGGGIVALVKWRSIKKQAEAEAMAAIQTVYQETIKDLRDDKEMMKNDNSELRANISDLKKTVEQNSKDISSLKQFKCVVTDCALRRKE